MKNNTFAYYLTKYFIDYLPNQVAASINTIHSYRDTFVQLIEFYKSKYNLSPEQLDYKCFTTKRIKEFLLHIETRRGVCISTRNQRLAAIHAFFRYVQYRDPAGFEQCGEIIAIPFKKAPVAIINYMSLEEITLLFSIPNQKNNKQLRDLAIMVLLYESGARVQELLDLSPANLRFNAITVIELHGKGNKTRLVPINSDVANIVKNYICRCERKNLNESLFVNNRNEKLTRSGIQYIIDKYISECHKQRPDLFKKRITSHCFRHSKAMHLLESGINLIYIRDFLGHSSIVTTEIYAKTNPKIKEEQLKKHSTSMIAPEQYNFKEKEDLIKWLKNNL